MKKKILSLVSVCLVLTMCVGMPVLAKTKGNDKAKIEKTINKYFTMKYESYGKLEKQKGFDKLFVEGKDSDEEKLIVDTMIEFRKMQVEDVTFDNYELFLDINILSQDDNTAQVEVYESSVINFNGFPGVDSEAEGIYNKLNLVKTKGKWLIKSVIYEDVIRDELEEYSVALNNSKQRMLSDNEINEMAQSKLLADARIDVDNYKKEIENADRSVEENIMQSRAALKSYNRSAAVTYARNNALSTNGIAGFYNYETAHGDCTNFVSACLYKGGIPMDTSGTNKWYYNSYGSRALAWICAEDFHQYLLKNNPTTTSSNAGLYARQSTLSSLREGDIVQNSKTTAGHSMIISKATFITGAAYKDHLICQRSTTKSGRLKDYPLASKGYTSAGYYKICGYY